MLHCMFVQLLHILSHLCPRMCVGGGMEVRLGEKFTLSEPVFYSIKNE